VLLSKSKIYKFGLAFDDKTSASNPLEVINTDVTYSRFDLLHTQLGDLIGPFFSLVQRGRYVNLRISPLFAVQ